MAPRTESKAASPRRDGAVALADAGRHPGEDVKRPGTCRRVFLIEIKAIARSDKARAAASSPRGADCLSSLSSLYSSQRSSAIRLEMETKSFTAWRALFVFVAVSWALPSFHQSDEKCRD
jgi:hypothetical protein